jgi:hypothetical protein
MTHPTTSRQAQTGDDPNVASAEAVLPPLAAIQQGYEEARACIIDPDRAPLNWVHDPENPHPATEEIDVDAVPPPVPHDPTPSTEAMTVAAKQLAEQQLLDEAALPAQTSPRTADFLGLRRWWRAFWTP